MKSIIVNLVGLLLFFALSAQRVCSSPTDLLDSNAVEVDSYPNNEYNYDYDGNEDVLSEYDETEAQDETPVFNDEDKVIDVVVGGTAHIPCTVKTPTSQILIISQKKLHDTKKILFVGGGKVVHNIKRYSLADDVITIQRVNKKDAGVIICEYQAQDVKVTHTLNVQYSPKITSSSEDQHVMAGSSVDLQCQANGNPKPTIKWTKVQGHMPSGEKYVDGYGVSLEDVDRHVEGTYECSADNGIGNAATSEVKVTVNYRPEIINEKEIIRTGEGDQVELICNVHARPAAIVVWTKDDHQLDDGSVEERNGSHRHVLQISPVSESNFGSYKCTATNDYGEDVAVIALTDLPKVPEFTSNRNSAEDTSYTLTWSTESYYPIKEYRIKYRKTKANASTDEPGPWSEYIVVTLNEEDVHSAGKIHKMRHTFADLDPATDYEAVVAVKNKDEWADEAVFTFSTKKELTSQHTTDSGSAVILSTLVFVASIIVPYFS